MSHASNTVAGIGTNLTPRSRADHLRRYITPSDDYLPRLLPLHIMPPQKSPTKLPSLGSPPPPPFGSPPPPPFGSPPPPFGQSFGSPLPSFGRSQSVGSSPPLTLDQISAMQQSQIKPPRRLDPLFGKTFHGCLSKCQAKCRTKHPHASGGTNRRRKNRKQKGTRRHGSRRYRR